jgi:hypothetical protein
MNNPPKWGKEVLPVGTCRKAIIFFSFSDLGFIHFLYQPSMPRGNKLPVAEEVVLLRQDCEALRQLILKDQDEALKSSYMALVDR